MRNILTTLISLSILNLSGQESNNNDAVFINFHQFKKNAPCEVENINIKSKSDLLLTLKKADFKCKDFKKVNKVIAIRYNKEVYYNMRYNIEFMTKNRFSKLLVKGKYCAFLVNESYPKNIQGQAGFHTGGMLGALILGPNGKNKLYYLDTDAGHKTKVLTKKRLQKILSQNKKLLNEFNKEKEISADLYLNYLKKLNKSIENK